MFARPLSNSGGILGLYFSLFDSLIFNQLDNQGLPESLSSVFAGEVQWSIARSFLNANLVTSSLSCAGALSGLVFRSPRGPRQALVAGALGAVGGAGIVATRAIVPSL